MSKDINTADMRPCDKCGQKMVPTFFRVQVDHAVVRRESVNSLLGTALMLGGGPEAWATARSMSPCDPIATVASSKTLMLCTECFCTGDAIASLWSDEAKDAANG